MPHSDIFKEDPDEDFQSRVHDTTSRLLRSCPPTACVGLIPRALCGGMATKNSPHGTGLGPRIDLGTY